MRKILPFFKSYTVDCGDGTTREVIKNVDDAFPLDVRTKQAVANVKANAETIGEVDISGGVRSVIEGLLFEIDDRNSSHMIEFRAAYVAYQAEPCQNLHILTSVLDRVMSGRERLVELVHQTNRFIAALESSPDQANQILEQFAPNFRRLGFDSPPLAAIEIAENQKAARSMATRDSEDRNDG